MSRNPGIAVFSVAATSLAPAGKCRPPRGPMASIMSSRIKIPASLISEAGVKARPAWIRVVGMVVEHRNGNAGRHKTKRADPPSVCPPVKANDAGSALLAGHVDAGQLKGLAFHCALDGNVMAGMRRHFVLRVDNVHFLVGVVHKHVLGAVLLDALSGALAGFLVRAFRPALAVGNPAGPGTVCCHGKSPGEQRCRNCR